MWVKLMVEVHLKVNGISFSVCFEKKKWLDYMDVTPFFRIRNKNNIVEEKIGERYLSYTESSGEKPPIDNHKLI